VLVAGGGIGGLAAALACGRAGWPVRLFEQTAAFAEVGAGVQAGPNVVRQLQHWGVGDALARVAAFPDRLQVRDARSGTELGCLRFGDFRQRYGAPYATVHRADLHGVLLQAVQATGQAELRLATAVAAVAQTGDEVVAALADGQQLAGPALVGADGVWSSVRHAVVDDGAPQFTGHLAYRALVTQDSLPAALRSQQVTVWLGPGLHVVQYPVRAGAALNVVAMVEGGLPVEPNSWDHQADAADLWRAMAGNCAALQDLLRALGPWRCWALSIRPPLRGPQQMARGRVALLGDAAHPMLPYLAQGAGMAIEDAGVLEQVLGTASTAADVPSALQGYAGRRWQRNARVQARSIRNGQIFHARGPLRWGRDTAMRLLGSRLLDMKWLYG
jgi:salicylate hydroxylase